jgi:apolipoprotein N-acyltransferase
MPWVLLAHSQVGHPALVQVADVAGAYGVSFVIVVVNALVAILAVRPRSERASGAIVVATAIVVGALVYGRTELRRWTAPPGVPLDVVIVQGGVPDAWRSTVPGVARTLARYRELVAAAAEARPDLVVLPENAISVSASANPELLQELARGLDVRTSLLVGGPREIPVERGRATVRNSAYLVAHDAPARAVYDKRELVPFGETTTWLLPGFVERRFGLATDYSGGDVAEPFAVAGARVGTVICWEGIHADAVRALVRAGAEVLVNLSNDDWFGSHAAREQHFRATLLRAVEMRRFLLRVTNSGDTAIIDARGAVVAAAPPGVSAVVSGRVTGTRQLTVYARVGDLFAWACVAVALGATFRCRKAP